MDVIAEFLLLIHDAAVDVFYSFVIKILTIQLNFMSVLDDCEICTILYKTFLRLLQKINPLRL